MKTCYCYAYDAREQLWNSLQDAQMNSLRTKLFESSCAVEGRAEGTAHHASLDHEEHSSLGCDGSLLGLLKPTMHANLVSASLTVLCLTHCTVPCFVLCLTLSCFVLCLTMPHSLLCLTGCAGRGLHFYLCCLQPVSEHGH